MVILFEIALNILYKMEYIYKFIIIFDVVIISLYIIYLIIKILLNIITEDEVLKNEVFDVIQETLPESFGNLVNLTHLNISNNQLTSLPESFGNLVNLTHLNISNNQLTSLPNSFSNLVNLAEYRPIIYTSRPIIYTYCPIIYTYCPIIYIKRLNILFKKNTSESVIESELLEQYLIKSLERDPHTVSLEELNRDYYIKNDILLLNYYHTLFNNLVNEEWKKLSEYILENPSSFKFLKKFLHKRLSIFLEELIKKTCSPEYMFKNMDESFDIENI